jgi:RNA polymerase sigma-70 factor (ECF subfamily)
MIMAENGASSYRRFLQGEEEALSEFVRIYSDALVRYAYGYVRSSAVAEDMAADAIAIILTKGKHFERQEQLLSYLYRTVKNRCIDYLRHHKEEIPLEDVEQVLGSGDPEKDLICKQRNRAIYTAMQKLPRQYGIVLQLHYLEAYSIPQICAIMQKSTKQVYNLLARAKSSLKPILEKEGVTYEDL